MSNTFVILYTLNTLLIIYGVPFKKNYGGPYIIREKGQEEKIMLLDSISVEEW